ncbi:glycosyltransferase family 4 protein [Ignavibacteria bacterium CHB1]|nr:glycosyltransferase family 4 protein [Ignavibacteriales bacterium]MDL1887744.1 glycosyltransferase family 4 protein [Ignavibacteria bacterium CHB1]
MVDIIKKTNKFKISVVTIDSGYLIPAFENMGVNVYNLAERGLFNPKIYFKLKKVLKELDPDIVHTHLLKADFYGRLAAKKNGAKHIISTCHNDSTIHKRSANPDRKNIFDRIDNFILDFTNSNVICISQKVKNYLSWRKSNLDMSRVDVIYNGIDISKSRLKLTKSERLKSRQSLNLSENDFVVTIIGRLEEQKGHLKFLENIKNFLIQNPNIKFLFIGDGSLRKEIESFTSIHSLDKQVTLLGYRNDVDELIEISDLIAVPSLWEGFGLVVAEGMIKQKPVIASRVGGIPEIIQHEHNGFLYDIENQNELLETFSGIMSGQFNLKKIGDNARQTIIEKFDIKITAQKYIELYRRKLKSNIQN